MRHFCAQSCAFCHADHSAGVLDDDGDGDVPEEQVERVDDVEADEREAEEAPDNRKTNLFIPLNRTTVTC